MRRTSGCSLETRLGMRSVKTSWLFLDDEGADKISD